MAVGVCLYGCWPRSPHQVCRVVHVMDGGGDGAGAARQAMATTSVTPPIVCNRRGVALELQFN